MGREYKRGWWRTNDVLFTEEKWAGLDGSCVWVYRGWNYSFPASLTWEAITYPGRYVGLVIGAGDKSGIEAMGTGWGHAGRMFRLRKEPRKEPWALQTVEVEQRRKNSQGTWEAAARKVKDILAAYVQEVKRSNCFKMQGRDHCAMILLPGQLRSDKWHCKWPALCV